VVGVLLEGSAALDIELSHGCAPIGSERTVTRGSGNVIHEIDGRPALDVISDYMGEDLDEETWAKQLTALAVGIKAPEFMAEDVDAFAVRFFPAMDAEARSITIPTEVRDGDTFWVMRRDYDKMSAGNVRVAARLRERLGERPAKFLFHFDCAGRGKVFLPMQEKLAPVRGLRDGIDEEVPWLGMVSYGERAPEHGEPSSTGYTAGMGPVG